MSKFLRQGNDPRSNWFERRQQDRFGAPSPRDYTGDSYRVLARGVQSVALREHELVEGKSVVVRRDVTAEECRQWLCDYGIRAQQEVNVLDARDQPRHAFVFKKLKHAAHFKLVWG